MKSLILFRHGKSDWDTGIEVDHERPLAPRGVRAAKTMGRFLELAAQPPDAVVTSSAVRARTAVELAVAAGNWGCEIRVTSALYEATPDAVLAEIHSEPGATQTLLLAGHEPTWSAMTSLFIGGGEVRFPTAAMTRIDFAVDRWADVRLGTGELVWLTPPKLFTRGRFEFVEPR